MSRFLERAHLVPLSPPVVEVDLAAGCFKPAKPNYERVKWCLTDRLGLEASFVISWWPKGQGVASRSYLSSSHKLAHDLSTSSIERSEPGLIIIMTF